MEFVLRSVAYIVVDVTSKHIDLRKQTGAWSDQNEHVIDLVVT